MSGQAIRPVVSGGSSGRIYGLVDPNELQQRQQQQRVQQQQEMARLYSIPTRTGGATQQSQVRQPVSLLSLMYPVSSGSDHRRVFEHGSLHSRQYSSYYQQQAQQQQSDVNIQELINRRQDLLRQSAENPNNYLVQLALEDCEAQISQLAANQQQGGVFPGSTDTSDSSRHGGGINERPEGMSRKQFNKMQPWVKKDSLRNGLRISGGIGKNLLKRMGWREGYGIGRVSSGPVEPVVPEPRPSDRRGLTTEGETSVTSSAAAGVAATGKHPVSVLMELCAKNHFAPPEFIEVMADGPSHKPHFIMKVRVNDIDYQPTNASSTKKDAKAMAAIVCLKSLGILSSTPATSNVAVEISTKTTGKETEKFPTSASATTTDTSTISAIKPD